MKRALSISVVFLISMCMFTFAQQTGDNKEKLSPEEKQEKMIYAQLKFIMEKAQLTKKEYSKFSKIYIAYQKELFDLNESNMSVQKHEYEELSDVRNSYMPFAPAKPSNEFFEKWQKINGDYLSKLEKNLSENTRQKIGAAQLELNQKLWNRWSQDSQRDFRRSLGAYGMMGFNMQHGGMPFSPRQNLFVAPNYTDIHNWLRNNPQEQERLKNQREYWQQHPEEYKEFQMRMAEQQKQNQERWNNMSNERRRWNRNFRNAWHMQQDSSVMQSNPFNPFSIPQK